MYRIKYIFTFLLVINLSYSQTNDSIIQIKTIVCYDSPVEDKDEFIKFQSKFKKDKELNKYMVFDTLYIYLQEKNAYDKELETRYSEVFKPHKIFDTILIYQLKSKSNFLLPKLTYKRYYDFDAMDIDSVTYVGKEKKTFLEKEKNKILVSTFFKEIKQDELPYLRRAFFEILRTRKKVFIIDEAENKNEKITLRTLDLRRFINDYRSGFFY